MLAMWHELQSDDGDRFRAKVLPSIAKIGVSGDGSGADSYSSMRAKSIDDGTEFLIMVPAGVDLQQDDFVEARRGSYDVPLLREDDCRIVPSQALQPTGQA